MSQDKKKNIIVISSGKGGVGKSIIGANLAISLALSKRKVILIDASFEIPNQHAIFGIRSPSLNLNDFASRKKNALTEITTDTDIECLKLISNAGGLPATTSMSFAFKNNFIKNIQMLNSDYVILDLGPSMNFNTIDFFTIADCSIIISTPEVTSVTNTYTYLKNIIFKKLENTFSDNDEIMNLLNIAKEPRNSGQIRTMEDIRDSLGQIDKTAHTTLDTIIKDFQPHLILNMVKDTEDINIGNDIVTMVRKNLNLKLEYLGYISDNNDVRNSLEDMKPFIMTSPESKTSILIHNIASKLMDLLEERRDRQYEAFELPELKLSEMEDKIKTVESKELEKLKKKLMEEEQVAREDLLRKIGEEKTNKFKDIDEEIKNEKSRRLMSFQKKMENAEKELIIDMKKRLSVEEKKMMDALEQRIIEEERKRSEMSDDDIVNER